jgi:hypothetical protein
MCLICSAKLSEGCMGRTEPIPPGGISRARSVAEGPALSVREHLYQKRIKGGRV